MIYIYIHREERTKLKLRNERGAHLMMDSFSKYKRNLYRYRSQTFPKNPKNRQEVDLDGAWKLTLDKSEPFLLADDGIENRILVITKYKTQIFINIYLIFYLHIKLYVYAYYRIQNIFLNHRFLEQKAICDFFVMLTT